MMFVWTNCSLFLKSTGNIALLVAPHYNWSYFLHIGPQLHHPLHCEFVRLGLPMRWFLYCRLYHQAFWWYKLWEIIFHSFILLWISKDGWDNENFVSFFFVQNLDLTERKHSGSTHGLYPNGSILGRSCLKFLCSLNAWEVAKVKVTLTIFKFTFFPSKTYDCTEPYQQFIFGTYRFIDLLTYSKPIEILYCWF